MVFLQSTVTGLLTDALDFSFLEDLASFKTLTLELRKGDIINETKDLFNCPGFVMLVHEDPDVLERDHQCIRKMEKEIYEKAVCKDS